MGVSAFYVSLWLVWVCVHLFVCLLCNDPTYLTCIFKNVFLKEGRYHYLKESEVQGQRLCPLLEDAEQRHALGHQDSDTKLEVSTKPCYFFCLFCVGSILNCRLSNMLLCFRKPCGKGEEILFLYLRAFTTSGVTDSKT